jgi:hypothetical protein
LKEVQEMTVDEIRARALADAEWWKKEGCPEIERRMGIRMRIVESVEPEPEETEQ